MTRLFFTSSNRYSRRTILTLSLGAGMAAMLDSCAPAPSPTPAPPAPKADAAQPPPAAPTAAPAKPAPAPTAAPTAAPKAAAKPSEKVVVRLDWFPLSYHAPFYVAIDKGWYAEQGLDVEAGQAQGSGQAALLVANGQATFGHVEGGALVKAVAAGQPLKSVALVFSKSMLGYAYGKDLDIKVPKDFEGKTYGAVPFAATFQLWPAFASANGIDTSKVQVVNLDPEATYQAIATKKVDVIDAAVGDAFLISELGRPAGQFRMSDYGLNLVGHSLAVNTATLQQKPDLVRRFLDTTLRAYDFTKSNDKEALDIFLKRNPETKRPLEENRLKETIPLWNFSGTQAEPQWQSTIDLTVKYAKLEKTPKTSDVFTNEFLPKR